MSDKPSFFSELKRRNVYKVAVAYAVVGWLLVQSRDAGLSVFRHSELGGATGRARDCDRLSNRARDRVGV